MFNFRVQGFIMVALDPFRISTPPSEFSSTNEEFNLQALILAHCFLSISTFSGVTWYHSASAFQLITDYKYSLSTLLEHKLGSYAILSIVAAVLQQLPTMLLVQRCFLARS